jgi:hypothetical protein
LARYNVTSKRCQKAPAGEIFEGHYVDVHRALVAVLAVAAWTGAVRENLWLARSCWVASLHPLVLMFTVSDSDDQPHSASQAVTLGVFQRLLQETAVATRRSGKAFMAAGFRKT